MQFTRCAMEVDQIIQEQLLREYWFKKALSSDSQGWRSIENGKPAP